jgi:anthraniloyl-CoA monooxygenase
VPLLWLGTTLPLEGFTFVFQESRHGLFTVHAYPFEEGALDPGSSVPRGDVEAGDLDQATEEGHRPLRRTPSRTV